MSSKQKEPILTEAYWDRPQPSDCGDKDRISIYQAVGAALNAWERLEEALSFMCAVFSDTRDAKAHYAIAEIFGSIESSGGRRTALERLYVNHTYPHHNDPRIKKPFKDLLEAVSHASRRRDDIAHGVTTEFLFSHSAGVDHGNKGCFLGPAKYNSARNKPFLQHFDELTNNLEQTERDTHFMRRERYLYTSEDIHKFETKFGELMLKTYTVAGSLIKKDGVISGLLGGLSGGS
jgi:hypothetical protein